MSKSLISNKAVVLGLIALLAASNAAAAEWGSVKGRFVVDGTPPKVSPLVVTKDQHCIDSKPINESVVVGEDGSLANAVVYLRPPRRGKVEVHPDYEAKLSEPAVLDNNGCSFKPHVTLVRVGQPFAIKNSDPVGHNTKATLLVNGAFNVTIAAGQEMKTPLTKPERMPLPVNCNIHPWMQGYVLVQDHPYMAVSGEDGTFSIENIPAGKHEFVFWHESGWVQNATAGKAKTDRRGVAQLTIAAGQTLDLGDIKVPAAKLK